MGTWKYVQTDKARWLLLTGGMLGLALSTRWSSLWSWGFTGLVLLWHLCRNQWPRWFQEGKIVPKTALWVAIVVGTMGVLPLTIYAATYIPFVLQGHGGWKTQLFTSGESGSVVLADAFKRTMYPGGHGWYKALSQQKDMWIYHSEIKETHPYSSSWWSWPLMAWPVKYFYEETPGWASVIWCIGNGVLWWTSVPALLIAIHFARTEKKPALGVVALFGLGMWLCWGIQPRPLIFMHYYLECMPFACLALAYFGARLWRSGEAKAQQFVRGFCLATVAWAIFFYPVLTALPIPNWYFYAHIWFGWQ
jgi:dolichyl-phosphate-mannose--protein O-mannosyl transferase